MNAKGLVCAAVLAGVAAGGVGAQGVTLSAGAYGDIFALGTIKAYDGTKDNALTVGGGLGLFFDAAFVEAAVGLDFGQHSDDNVETDMTFFTVSLLAKYPIVWSKRLTWFPLLGVDWKIFLASRTGAGGAAVEMSRADVGALHGDEGAYDAFSIDAGLGADCTLTEKLFLRVNALLGFKLPNKAEREEIRDRGGEFFACGPTIKVGLGLKF